MTEQTYRCSACLEGTVTRTFDVSHLERTCDRCGEFARFVHEGIFEQFEAFEQSPPDGLDWDRLDRLEKFYVCNGIVRDGKSIDDFDVASE